MPTQTLAMLTLMSPAWLLGLVAAAGLPVAAHLLSRVRYREVAFPTMRFVEQASIEASKIDRPRQLLLMLLRILALCCVVFAFTRPQWEAAAATQPATGGESVVIILDASASMQRTQRGATLFDQARRRALAELETLDPARDTASIILADRSPRMLLPEPAANHVLLRERLAQAECTSETADLAGAVSLADAVLQQQGKTGRILIISDGQRANRPASGLAQLAPGVAIREHRVGGLDAGNLAVRIADVSPYPPVLGSPLTLRVDLSNFGPSANTVTLFAEGAGDQASTSLTLPPWVMTTQTLSLTPSEPGLQTLRLWVEPADGFGLDNAAGRVIEVAPARKVLLFTDNTTAQYGDTAAERVALALAPVDGDGATVQVECKPPAAFASLAEHTGGGACWVLTGIEAMPDGYADILRQHLEAGGGVVWVVDTPAARRAANGLAFSPLRFTGEPAHETVVAAVRFDHPAFAVFEGPARASLVGQQLPGVMQAETDAEVLMRSADGRAILAMQRVGRGRFFMVNADLNPADSDFASQPAFVAWINELVAYAAPGPAMPEPLHPGDALPHWFGGHAAIDRPPGDRTADDADDRVTSTGFYRAFDTDSQMIAGVYASIDPDESDFTAAQVIDTSQATTRTQRSHTALGGVTAGDTMQLWPVCILGALLLLGFESLTLLSYARREGGV
ncbi:MAG: BatA and WFA domain-containing protein [Planctomycetota bacterium]